MPRISAMCLLLTMVCVVSYELLIKSSALVFIAGVTLVFYLLLQRSYINRVGRLLIGLAVLSCILIFWTETPLLTLENALSRGAFFGAFLAALAFIRLAAQRSLIVQKCGQLVVNQPPSRRYGIITMASYFFANVLNFGVLHLLGMMIVKGNTLEAAGGRQHVQDLRRKRMSLAILRGFALLPLASPFSIALTLMLANMPQLQWVPLMLMGGCAAIILFIIGWVMDYFQNPLPATVRVNFKETSSSWKGAYPFLGIIVGVFLISVSVENIAEVSLSVAILSVFPIAGIVWYFSEHFYLHKTYAFKQVALDLPLVLNDLRSEVAIIGSACFFGVVMTEFIPKEMVISLLDTLALSEVGLAIFLCLLVALISHFGISPFISATFLASSLAPLLIGQYSPEMLALGIMSGWSLATSGSPVSISTLIVSAISNQPAQTIAYRWNAAYTLISLVVLILWIVVLSNFL